MNREFVWIVEAEGSDQDSSVLGIFDSEEKAEAFLDAKEGVSKSAGFWGDALYTYTVTKWDVQ